MMRDIFFTPFLLGLSTGLYCFVYCVPFIAPVLISRARQRGENVFLVWQFILGRLIGYLLFGAVFGFLGERFNGILLDIIVNGALAALSLILIFQGAGLLKWKILSFCERFKKFSAKVPLLMGVLMGVNVCPPFLMSLTYVFGLGNAVKGVIYFAFFFLGTTVYLLPLFFLGPLSRQREFQLAGRLAAVIVGISFFAYGVYGIARILM